jgi:hypothetical protein
MSGVVWPVARYYPFCLRIKPIIIYISIFVLGVWILAFRWCVLAPASFFVFVLGARMLRHKRFEVYLFVSHRGWGILESLVWGPFVLFDFHFLCYIFIFFYNVLFVYDIWNRYQCGRLNSFHFTWITNQHFIYSHCYAKAFGGLYSDYEFFTFLSLGDLLFLVL